MKDQRYERQSTSAILTRGNELADRRAEFRSRSISNQAPGALHDVRIAQNVDLRFDFLDTASKSRSEPWGIKYGIGVAVEEYENIPRQK
jgi:hypothetical protein